MTLPEEFASQAESMVSNLLQTDYQHIEHIDVDARVYDCDCSGFVGFVLELIAPAHYAMILPEPDWPIPRAFKYYEFFASLTPESTGGWHRIDYLKDARPGDIIAWRFPTIEANEDTGHVMFVDETPTVDATGIYSVVVCDSAIKPHFDDTRGTGEGQFGNGVGRGTIRFMVDADGKPISFLFSPPASAEFTYLPIAIGRAEAL
jgi:hypothetical protein